MKPKAHVLHSAYGRTRISIPGKKKNLAYFAELESSLSELTSVESVRGNPLVGSLLIHHKQGESQVVIEQGSALGLFELVHMASDEHIHIVDEQANALQTKTAYKASFGILLGLAAIQAARGNFLAPASSLLLDAINLLPRLKHPPAKKE